MEIEDLSWNENISKKFNHPLLEKMLTLFAFFLKILKTLIISIMIMWVMI